MGSIFVFSWTSLHFRSTKCLGDSNTSQVSAESSDETSQTWTTATEIQFSVDGSTAGQSHPIWHIFFGYNVVYLLLVSYFLRLLLLCMAFM